MTALEQIAAWGGSVVAGALALLGLRLRSSRVSREVAQNEAEATHSSGLVEDRDYWRRKSQLDTQRASDAELLAAGLKADLAHLIAIREERDGYKKIADSQAKISADLALLADTRAAQLRHVQSNYQLRLRILKRQCPDVDFSILDSQPAPLRDE